MKIRNKTTVEEVIKGKVDLRIIHLEGKGSSTTYLVSLQNMCKRKLRIYNSHYKPSAQKKKEKKQENGSFQKVIEGEI